MEQPHYGRTGLLVSRLSGLPVTQPRLITSSDGATSTSRTLKWRPSLLTIPQQLLDALRREDDGAEDGFNSTGHRFNDDPTLVTYLRVATIAEFLERRWRYGGSPRPAASPPPPSSASPSRAETSGLYASVLKWSRGKVNSTRNSTSSSNSKSSAFFAPAYKLLVMKDEKRVVEYANITWRSVWLLGKEPVVNDVPLEHPSCSGQHAALEMRFVLVDEAPLHECVEAHTQGSSAPHAGPPHYAHDSDTLKALCEGMWEVLASQQEAAGGDASGVWTMELQLIDLGSTNHTKLNGAVVPAMEPTTVIESDVFEFGYSTRKYVVLRNA
ncbi:putative mitochondrial hypothetical protein [Leptomonas pyrrhocoris]|uniref:Uncharacterized protein n=1 Tax=Leptomonas pyrrhocoris TaxID=157538 RepID=A0A0M9G1K1_LEPPY|nr:putative mitochondrial hypothetical protein [Leptomonas pyrrhocoris]KPA80299.1 putative mitochondrial hypothetical protein [Leptomonas pyrrhocoris]|eukprot:XP_015658738.1 putative mitochondrial hypothetical protein [Leptomonas pyrrhocoris]